MFLLHAEAQGNYAASRDLINQVRTRAKATPVIVAEITSVQSFEDALSTERRIEFVFEDHRWFDLLRYNKTMTTIAAEAAMKEHFSREYPLHYMDYPLPGLTLSELKAFITPEKLLLAKRYTKKGI